jgi:hypothetical protein
MTVATARSLSLHDVIAQGAGGPARLEDHLTSKLGFSAAAKAMLPSTRRSIEGELRAAVDGVLRQDVIAVLGAGWQVSAALREAAVRTAPIPDVAELVELVTQTLTQAIRPSVSVYLNGRLLVSVELEIILETAFRDFSAVVRAGALVAVDFGRCVAKVSIRTGAGTLLAERELTLTSNTRLGLPHPITLVKPAAR